MTIPILSRLPERNSFQVGRVLSGAQNDFLIFIRRIRLVQQLKAMAEALDVYRLVLRFRHRSRISTAKTQNVENEQQRCDPPGYFTIISKITVLPLK